MALKTLDQDLFQLLRMSCIGIVEDLFNHVRIQYKLIQLVYFAHMDVLVDQFGGLRAEGEPKQFAHVV